MTPTKETTRRRTWPVASLLLGAVLCLTVQQPAAGQVPTLASPSISLSGINVTPLDWETFQGTFTLTNSTGLLQAVQIESMSMVIEYVGETGTSSTCRQISVFPNLSPGAIIADTQVVTVNYSAVCTQGTPPLDTHEVDTLVGVKLVGSDTIFTTSGTSHL